MLKSVYRVLDLKQPAKTTTAAFGLMTAAMLLASCQSSDVLESASTSGSSSSASELETSIAPQPSANPDSLQAMTAIEPETTAPLPGVETGLETRVETVEAPAAPQTAQPQTGPALAAIDPAAVSPSPAAIPDTIPGTLEGGIAPAAQSPKKTYLINGLLSAVPFIGYGFRNLKKKMPEAEIYSYMGVVEGPAIIAPKIVKEAEAAWRANPDTMINLVGISLGADLVTVIANELDQKGVPVNYLGIVDGTNLRPIPDNVRKADNLTCSYLDCTRARAKMAKGNTSTIFERRVYKSSHIPLGDNDQLHARVIAQSNSR